MSLGRKTDQSKKPLKTIKYGGARVMGSRKYKLLKKVERIIQDIVKLGVNAKHLKDVPVFKDMRGKEWFFKIQTKRLTGLISELSQFKRSLETKDNAFYNALQKIKGHQPI